jgi:hypothetical protein
MFKKVLVMFLAVYFVAQMSGLVNYWASDGTQIALINDFAEEESKSINSLPMLEDLICSEFSLHDISRLFWLTSSVHTYSEPEAGLIFLSTYSPPPERA